MEDYKQTTLPFSDLLHELIIDEQGDILPVSHGFSRKYRLGNINDFDDFNRAGKHYLATHYDALQALYQSAYAEIRQHEDIQVFNWSEWMVQKSKKMAPGVLPAKGVA